MKRKVIKLAEKTHVVSLPYQWIKKYGVKKGDEINLEENNDSIQLSISESRKSYEGNFNFKGYPIFLVDRIIARIYEMGFDKVTISYDSDEQIKLIESRMPEFLGFAIIEDHNNSVVIQDISSKGSLDFDSILRKAFFVVQGMLSSLAKAYQEKDDSLMDNIIKDDLLVNKYTYFCLRQINKNMIGSNEAYVLFYLTKSLEDLGDIIKRFIHDFRKDGFYSKNIYSILSCLDDLFRISLDFFYKPKDKEVIKALKLKDKIFDSINKISNKKAYPLLMDMTEMNRKIYHFSTLRLHTLVDKDSNK